MEMRDHVQQEIEELHQFFQDWYNGVLPQSNEAFARFADAMALGFTIIFPSGNVMRREPLVEALYKSYDGRDGFRIWIKNVQIHQKVGDVIVASYQEWQRDQEQTTARLSSVILERDSNAPNGLRWLHVHETWLPNEHP